MAVYDAVAEHYDASRGGEQRGADFASELDARLPNGTGPVLEVGVGTGVVALGLARLGRSVIGVDVAAAMLLRARARLGGVLVRGDARRLPMGDASVQHAVSVWVVHAVEPPENLFAEVARVLRPGGRYLVCPTNRMRPDDPVEPILHAMFDRASRLHPTWRRNPVTADDILDWGRRAGLEGHVETFESRSWVTTRENEVATINDRAGPALQGLDDDAFRAVTQPAFDALRSLPRGPITRGAQVDIVVLTHPPWGPTISTTVRGGDTVSNRGGEDG
jgi:ubiquinone/menaquinone biosynthesis C-methylase UbiE